MPTETQGVRVLTAWEELLEALKESGDEGLQVVRDLHVLTMVGGAAMNTSLFHHLHERAELVRQALRRCEVDKCGGDLEEVRR